MSKNLFVHFQQNSGEFLKALGELSMKADSGKTVMFQHKDLVNMVATMEFFWDITENIFQEYEKQKTELRMTSAVEHAKVVLLQNELKSTYNELYKVRDKIPETLARLMATTKLPTREELGQDINLSNKPLIQKLQQHGKEDKPV